MDCRASIMAPLPRSASPAGLGAHASRAPGSTCPVSRPSADAKMFSDVPCIGWSELPPRRRWSSSAAV
eukprot:1295122-Pyramimonas_sp.AAC.1